MPSLSQDLRNTIYAVVAALTGLATALGFLDQQQVLDLNTIVETALNLVSGLLALAALVVAWWNSLTSRVATLRLHDDGTIVEVEGGAGVFSAE